MDKYEYNVKSDQIKKLYSRKEFEAAAKIADEIDWYRIKDNAMINRVADIYENTKQYEKAKEILLIAYERSPLGRQLAYKLTILALRTKNFVEADEFYQDFVEMSPSDVSQYLLKYRIAKAKGEDIEVLIKILEAYVDVEMDERWQYELAKLYHEAGFDDKCIAMCDELELWFNDGKYVNKAKELKKLITGVIEEYNKRYAPQNLASAINNTSDKNEDKEFSTTESFGENLISDIDSKVGEPDENDVMVQDDSAYSGENIYQDINSYGNDDVSDLYADNEISEDSELYESDEIYGTSDSEVNNEPDETDGVYTHIEEYEAVVPNVSGRDYEENNSYTYNEIYGKSNSLIQDETDKNKYEEINNAQSYSASEEERRALEVLKAVEEAAFEAQRAADMAKRLVEEARLKVEVIRGTGNKHDSTDIKGEKHTFGSSRSGIDRFAGMSVDEIRRQLDEEEELLYGNPDLNKKDSMIEIFEFDKDKEGKGNNIGDELTKTAEIDIDEIKLNLNVNDDIYNTANIQAALAKSMEKLMGLTEEKNFTEVRNAFETEEETEPAAIQSDDQTENIEEPEGPESDDEAENKEEPEAPESEGQPENKEEPEGPESDDRTENIEESEEPESDKRTEDIEEPEEPESDKQTEDIEEPEEPESDDRAEYKEEPEVIQSDNHSEDKEESEAIQSDNHSEDKEESEAIQSDNHSEDKEEPEALKSDNRPENIDESAEIPPESTEELFRVREDDSYLDDYSNEPTKRINRDEINRLLNGQKTIYQTVSLSPLLNQEDDGRIGLTEQESLEEQIEGQMTIDEVMAGFEKNKDDEEKVNAAEFKAEELADIVTEDDLEEILDNKEAASDSSMWKIESPEESSIWKIESPEESSSWRVDSTEIPEKEKAITDEEISEKNFSDNYSAEADTSAESPENAEEDSLAGSFVNETPAENDSDENELVNESAVKESSEAEGSEVSLADSNFEDKDSDSNNNTNDVKFHVENHRIPDEYRNLFNDFVGTGSMEEDIARTLDNLINNFVMDGTSRTNNVIITGSTKIGKTTLGLSIIKAANRGRNRSGRRVAKVKASVLNKRGVALAMTQILGTDVIIEQAGNLMPNTLVDLMIAMKNYTEEMLIVLEDDKAAIDRMLNNTPDLNEFFTNRLDIHEMEINDMVVIAKEYAAERFYGIDEMGELALYAKLDDISGRNPVLSIEDIQEVVDDAISHANRFGLGKLFGKIRKGKGEMGILTEQDFL